jgi:DNA-binding NarL/FixJ family response regulator
MKRRTVFVVDDHPLVREWLATLINEQPDLIVCGEAEDAPTALERIGAAQPHVAIVDLMLERGSGLDLIKDLNRLHPKVGVIVLSMHDERLYAERCLRAGARGYLMKRETAKKVVTAIQRVLEGKLYISDAIAASMMQRYISGTPPADQSPEAVLSDREVEVFSRLGQGNRTREIAEALHISMKTVQVHCAHIKAKLQLANANELLREAVRWHERHLRP